MTRPQLVNCKSASGVYNYTEMGMADGRNKNPTVQWELLQIFAEERGTLTWDSHNADRKKQKHRERLAENLRAFFGIEGDPFRLTDDCKGWRAAFRISPDE